MTLCNICKKPVTQRRVTLTNGSTVHETCLKSLQEKELKLKSNLTELKDHLYSIKMELAKRNRVGFKIFSVFTKPIISIDEIKKDKEKTEKLISNLSFNVLWVYNALVSIYDFFSTYPPDWDERKNQIIERDGKYCKRCGNSRNLHVHHVTPLSKGGTNEIANLQFLCEDCHSKKHGGRDFSGKFKNSETAFSKRLSSIEIAIQQRKQISFGYKKPSQKGYKKRTIKPIRLKKVPHRDRINFTLCVFGYCELRKANRKFALKRMKGLKIL